MEILIVVIGLFLDRITKIWAVKTLSTGKEIIIIKNFLSLEYLENQGAAFGIFQKKQILLALVTSIIVIVMIVYLIKHRNSNVLFRISLSLIIAGALGNLYDRIRYKFVVDFIRFHYKEVYSFPTFNVADICVTFGTILLAIYILKDSK